MGRVALETESRALLAVLNMLKVEGREIRVKGGGERRGGEDCTLLPAAGEHAVSHTPVFAYAIRIESERGCSQ